MASYRRKGKGWEVRFYDAGGQRRSKMVDGTLRQAKAEAAILEGGLGRRGTTPVTFADMAEVWLAHGGRRTSELSQQAAAGRMRRHAIPGLGPIPVADITPATIEALHRDLMGRKGLAPTTVRLIHSDISGTLRRAVRDGLIDRNPATPVELPSMGRHEMVMPTIAAVVALLDALDSLPGLTRAETALAMRLAVATGARLGEVTGLRWGDVDWTSHSVAIVRGVIKPSGRPAIVKGTKGRTRRRVAIPQALVARLAQHRDVVAGSHLDVGDDDYILIGRRPGEPLVPDALRARFVIERDKLGLRFRFHDLRHLAASMFLADMPVLAASAAVGHRRTSTTTDTYGHLLDEGLDRRTAEAVEKRIDL